MDSIEHIKGLMEEIDLCLLELTMANKEVKNNIGKRIKSEEESMDRAEEKGKNIKSGEGKLMLRYAEERIRYFDGLQQEWDKTVYRWEKM